MSRHFRPPVWVGKLSGLAVALAFAAWAAPSFAADVAHPESRVAAVLPQGCAERCAAVPVGFRLVDRSCTAAPAPHRRQRVAALALAQWEAFGRPTAEPGLPFNGISSADRPPQLSQAARLAKIAGYWAAVPTRPGTLQDYMHRVEDLWAGEPLVAVQEHWSAAFTSWVMCEAGFSYNEFRRSFRHRDYIDQALADPTAGVRVVGADRVVPSPGDLLCADLTPNSAPLRRLEDYQPGRSRMLHCHVVTGMTQGAIWVVGGNVGGEVALSRVPVVFEPGGPAHVEWTGDRPGGYAWFAVVQPNEPGGAD